MTKQQMCNGMIVLSLAAVGIVGCHVFEGQQDIPTAPIEATADQFSNFFTMREPVSSQFEWEPGHDVFCVNVPTLGDYRLTYGTNWGVFNIVFRANRPTYMYIGLQEGDVVHTIGLEDGAIPAAAIPVAYDDNVIRFATPASPVEWTTVFTSGKALPLPQGTVECRPITSTKNALSFQAAPSAAMKTSRQDVHMKRMNKKPSLERKARLEERVNKRNARRQARQKSPR